MDEDGFAKPRNVYRMLTDADIEALAEVLNGNLSAREHEEHHRALSMWIARENRKAERVEKLKVQIAGWTIISFLGGIATGAYHAAIYLKEHLK